MNMSFGRLPLRLAGLICIWVATVAFAGPADATVVLPIDIPSPMTPAVVSHPLIAVAKAGDRLVAVGQMGHIVISDDDGRSWVQAQVPVSVDLVAVQFATPEIGWVTGQEGVVLRTDDGGKTWRLLLDGKRAAHLIVDYYKPRAATGGPEVEAALKEANRFLEEDGARPFLDVWFSSPENGFIVGAWGLILHTDDGGKTWTPWMDREENPGFSQLYSIRPAAGRLWIVGERGLILALDDARQKFVSVPTPAKGTLFGMCGTADTMVIFGISGEVFASHDAGKSWIPASLPTTSGISGGIVLKDGRIALADTGGEIWTSGDGGNHFELLPAQKQVPYFGLTQTNAGELALAGPLGIQVLPIPAARAASSN